MPGKFDIRESLQGAAEQLAGAGDGQRSSSQMPDVSDVVDATQGQAKATKPEGESQSEGEENQKADKKADDDTAKAKKRRDLIARLDAKHKQYAQEKEARLAAEARIAELEAKQSEEKPDENESGEIEDFDTLVDFIKKNMVSATDVKKMMEEQLKEYADKYQQQQVMTKAQRMEQEFGQLLDSEYLEAYDEEIDGYPEEVISEIKTIVQRFSSDPEFWLDFAKENGLKEMKRVLLRKQAKGTDKVEKVKKLLDNEEKASTASKSASVSGEDEMAGAKSLRELFDIAAKRIKKGG